jgi:hypothetical protein
MKKKISHSLSLIFLLSLFLQSCSVFEQTSEMKAFGKCEFRIEEARNMRLAGVNIQDKSSLSELSLTEVGKIGIAIAGGALPLNFDLDIQVKNPYPTLAAMNKLDWILLIDNVEMTRGVLDKRIEIQASQVTTFPVAISLDLMKSMNGKSGEALMNFALNLSGTGSKPTRIKLKAKPTIYFGTTPVEYPGYITIRQEFGSQ